MVAFLWDMDNWKWITDRTTLSDMVLRIYYILFYGKKNVSCNWLRCVIDCSGALRCDIKSIQSVNGYMFSFTPNDQSPSGITEEQVIIYFAQPINMPYNIIQHSTSTILLFFIYLTTYFVMVYFDVLYLINLHVYLRKSVINILKMIPFLLVALMTDPLASWRACTSSWRLTAPSFGPCPSSSRVPARWTSRISPLTISCVFCALVRGSTVGFGWTLRALERPTISPRI